MPTPPPVTPQPIVQSQTPPIAPAPVKPAPIKPVKPKLTLNPSDLTVAEAPASPVKHTAKPAKPKKPVAPDDTANAASNAADSAPDNTGLSKEEIAARLGSKLQATGVTNSIKIGPSGSDHSQANNFSDFYLSIHDQVIQIWQQPNLTQETAVSPEVVIHVEKDGRVPPELVTLNQSSGNQEYDDSALAAAKSLGNLHEPLPEGCPPDIHINFKLTR